MFVIAFGKISSVWPSGGGCTAYVDSLRGCEEWRRLKAIRDKEAFAKRMMAIFYAVNFDKEVKKIQEDAWGWLSGDL